MTTPSYQLVLDNVRRHGGGGAHDKPHEVDTLQSLLELVRDPAAAKTRLAELAKATLEARDWSNKANRAKGEVAKAEQDLAVLRKKHEEATVAHQARLEQQRIAFEVEKKAIADLKAKAAADRDAAHALRADVERRYAAFLA